MSLNVFIFLNSNAYFSLIFAINLESKDIYVFILIQSKERELNPQILIHITHFFCSIISTWTMEKS